MKLSSFHQLVMGFAAVMALLFALRVAWGLLRTNEGWSPLLLLASAAVAAGLVVYLTRYRRQLRARAQRPSKTDDEPAAED